MVQKRQHANIVTLLLVMLFVLPNAQSQPVNSAVQAELFKITRNKDAHEIIYYLNTDKSGRLDQKQPVEAYWIRYDIYGNETGRPLNAVERRYAYGLKFMEISEHAAQFQFVSYERDLFLEHEEKGYVVRVNINGKMLRLERVHITLGSGTFWVPEIKYLELHAVDTASGKPIVELIKNP